MKGNNKYKKCVSLGESSDLQNCKCGKYLCEKVLAFLDYFWHQHRHSTMHRGLRHGRLIVMRWGGVGFFWGYYYKAYPV